MIELLTSDSLRDCMEGTIPATIATCDGTGVPNVSRISQVHFVDFGHVALSYQFFNKTRRNILQNPYATVHLMHPDTVAEYRLSLQYLRTETSGALFEAMKAKLAGIASHAGMQGVFRLLGADVYRVLSIVDVPGVTLAAAARENLLPGVRLTCERIARCDDLDTLFDVTLESVRTDLDVPHAMILLADGTDAPLFTVASAGYDNSGVGSEIRFGDGVIGVAAAEGVPIRITHLTSDTAYSRAAGTAAPMAREIPFPGLIAPLSQMAVPMTAGRGLMGVLFAESSRDFHFRHDHEEALATVAAHLATAIQGLRSAARTSPSGGAAPSDGPPAVLSHHASDDSVFIDRDYLIKGVAGAILWKLVRDHVDGGRQDFTNRELRIAPGLRLPQISDNLEARLILLRRRLAERCDFMKIEKTGRGRFRLVASRPLVLEDL